VKAGLDPVTFEVIRNALPAIANEMSADLQRSSYNMMVYEVRDYCCALVGKDGRLWSQNVGGVSHFVSDLGVVIADAMARYGEAGFRPGDVLLTNHQAVAGQHLNNVVVYTPLYFEGELLAFAVVRAHWMDVGGLSTGFGAGQRIFDPWVEGLQLNQLKIYEAGEVNGTLLQVIRDNIRYPESSLGDLRAQIAACRLAERRLGELLARYGGERVLAYIEAVFDATEARCRRVVETIPDGVYEAESFVDHDGYVRDERVRILARVTVQGGEMVIDFSGCSGERRGAINSRTRAGAYVAYKALTAPLEPVNEGSFRALTTIIPEGNVMMARYPAPMSKWSMILPTVVDTVLKALSPALPDRIPAAHFGVLGGTVVVFGRDPRNGRRFVLQSIEGGGWGGRPGEDGESAAVSVCQGDVRNAPVESMEVKAPILVWSRRLRTDSGGPGRWRGGLGVDVEIENLVELTWNLSQDGRHVCPPWGLKGGGEGAVGDYCVRPGPESPWESVDVVLHPMPPGSRALVRTAGGGGFGDPYAREPWRVAADVDAGFVSRQAAFDAYGVVLREDGEVDEEATAAERSRRILTRDGLREGVG
jgi:N-methylhydantoinase B